MTRAESRKVFEAFGKADYPPAVHWLNNLASAALSAASETTTNPARIAFICVYAITASIGQNIDGEATPFDGPWDDYRVFLKRLGALVAKVAGPHDATDVINELGEIADQWMVLRTASAGKC